MKTEEKNKVIAEWLGFETQEIDYLHSEIPVLNRITEGLHIKRGNILTHCNFLNDRNQQKLIEDKLIKLNFNITYDYDQKEKIWEVCIREAEFAVMKFYLKSTKYNKSKDIAFIDAVIDLIKLIK